MDIRAEDLTPEDIKLLPRQVLDIARIAGMEAAIACVNAFRGMVISIPKGEHYNKKGIEAFAKLAAGCGREAALALCAEYGGEMLFIPRCHTLRGEMRNREIRRAFDAGEDTNTLARRFDMTYRAVEIILNRAV